MVSLRGLEGLGLLIIIMAQRPAKDSDTSNVNPQGLRAVRLILNPKP